MIELRLTLVIRESQWIRLANRNQIKTHFLKDFVRTCKHSRASSGMSAVFPFKFIIILLLYVAYQVGLGETSVY